MDAELRFHLEQQVAALMREGLGEPEARDRARREFGAIELAKDECRDQRPFLWLDHLLRDIRLAARGLRRSPGFSLVSIFVLALGIGASTSIFSIVNGVLLKAVPYTEPDRLFAIHQSVPEWDRIGSLLPVSARHFSEWRNKATAFDGLAIALPSSFVLTGDGRPERIPAAIVSAEYFSVLGLKPRLGRVFRREEEPPGRDRVVVLSHELWQRRFQSAQDVIGRTVRVNGEPYDIVGVLGPDARPALLRSLHPITADDAPPQLWKPLGMRPEQVGAVGDFNFAGLARLKAAAGPARAAAELSALATAVARQELPTVTVNTRLVPVQEQVGAASRQALLLLLAAVGVVLIIVCLSVGNLLLARCLARLHDLSVRTALGASRILLAAPMLAESLLLAVIGGFGGLLVARFSVALFVARAPVELPRMEEIGIDGPVLCFAFGLTLLTAVLTGWLPAWRFSRLDPHETLKSGPRTVTAARGAGRLRQVLVGVQIGLSMVSLIAATLLLHSLIRLNRVDKGFGTDRILTVDVPLLGPAYGDEPARARTFGRILEDIRALPGVQSAGISNKLPLKGEGSNNIITAQGVRLPLLERPVADFRFVNPEYFQTFSIPVREGRVFADSDGDRRLAVISAQLAARVWPGQSAVGKRFHLGDEQSPLNEVIGIAGDVRSTSLDKTPPLTAYFPFRLRNRNTMMLAVRTTADPAALAGAVRNAIWKSDPEIAPGEMQTMAEVVSGAVAARRFETGLVTLFAGIGVLLACVGVYGVVAYAMTARRSEIGIRMALGATRGRVVAAGLGRSAMPVVAGLCSGLAASLALSRLLRGMLFGVEPGDPRALGVAAALLAAATLGACIIPIVRASRLDPALTLRNE